MNFKNFFHMHGLGAAAVFCLITANAMGQNMKLTQPAFGDQTALAIGEMMTVVEVPKPEWTRENGTSVARLRISSDAAAAWQIAFLSLNLPDGGQMYVYGVDANGVTRAIHGPYEEHGPLNVPDFQTDIIEGGTMVLEVRSTPSEAWPFTIGSVERFSVERLAQLRANGLQLQAEYRPPARKKEAPVIQSAWVGDRLVKYEVINGLAVMEGDIVLGRADEMSLPRKNDGRKESHIRTGQGTTMYWLGGYMPFTVQTGGGLQQGSTLATQIQTAIDNWNAKFPGIIKARTNEVNYVTFRFEDGVCSSDVGRQGGQQFINLGNGCAAGNVMHEIAHAMGFHHEHTRPDRGNFVTINWGNIKWFKGHNFEIPSSGESAASGAYDFGSIMHYAVDAFSSNGQNTITINSPVPAGVTVGQRNDFSSGDETAIRKLYCGPVTANGPATMEFEPEGGATGFIISVPPYCTWTATSTQPWIKLTGIISGTGSKYITFSVQPNTGKYPRSGSITYQGRSTVIKQAGSWTNSKLD